jgi:hypothetical protein
LQDAISNIVIGWIKGFIFLGYSAVVTVKVIAQGSIKAYIPTYRMLKPIVLATQNS